MKSQGVVESWMQVRDNEVTTEDGPRPVRQHRWFQGPRPSEQPEGLAPMLEQTHAPSLRVAATKTHALYRFFDEAGELLYVGITMNPAARWKQHQADKQWWHEVANITVEPHRDRTAVLEAEALAIKTEHPRYNVTHAPAGGYERPQRLRWCCYACSKEILEGEAAWLRVYQRCIANNLLGQFSNWSDGPSGLAEWRPWHDDCLDTAPGQGPVAFSIRLEELGHPLSCLYWSNELSEEDWLRHTDWWHVMACTIRAFGRPELNLCVDLDQDHPGLRS